jgi:cystathionine beta-lyase/cystathionine gamma-synthase
LIKIEIYYLNVNYGCYLLILITLFDEIMDLVIQSIDGQNRYCRTVSNELNSLAEALKKAYENKSNVAHSLVVPSGTSAMTIALDSLVKRSKPINIIYGNELYCDTHRLIKYLNKFDGCPIYSINVNNNEQIFELFEQLKGQTNILVLESCSNPSGYIFDWQIIPKLRKMSKTLYVVVDNTWLTHFIFNPLQHHADVVVLSLTKYYGGGKHIGGALLAKSTKLYKTLNYYIKVHGLHISPLACKIIAEQVNTLEQRIIQTSETTKKVIEYMKSNAIKLDYPYLHSEEKVKMYFKNNLYPGVISFFVPLNLLEAEKLIKSINIEFMTSYGSANSRICNFLVKYTDNETCLRLAIGYCDIYERLENDLLKKLTFKNLETNDQLNENSNINN